MEIDKTEWKGTKCKQKLLTGSCGNTTEWNYGKVSPHSSIEGHELPTEGDTWHPATEQDLEIFQTNRIGMENKQSEGNEVCQ